MKNKINNIILKKVKAIDPKELDSTKTSKYTITGRIIKNLIGVKCLEEVSTQDYFLMFPFGKVSRHMDGKTFKTLTSMRNVDAECSGKL